MAGPGAHRVGSVEMTRFDDGSVALRDMKTHPAPAVRFTPQEWADFVRGIKADQFGAGPAGRPRAAGPDVESTVRLKV